MKDISNLRSVWFSHDADRYGYGHLYRRLKPEMFDLRESMALPRQYARTIREDLWVLSMTQGTGPVVRDIGVKLLDDPTVHVLRRLPEVQTPERFRRSISHVLVMSVADIDTLDALAALVPPHTWTDDMFDKQSVTQFLTQTITKGVAR